MLGPLVVREIVYRLLTGEQGHRMRHLAMIGGHAHRMVRTVTRLREDFAKMARDNIAAFFGDAPHWSLKIGDLFEGFEETGVDRMFLDVAEPGRALAGAAAALRPGGVLVCYVPTALQLKDTVDALNESPHFAEIESFETLLRHWQVKGLSVRPLHRMVAHSAFIIVSRRIANNGWSPP